jgi:hypothetical protein
MVGGMPPSEPCPDCGGTIVYMGLFVIECATRTCRHFAGAVDRAASTDARAATRSVHDDEERTLIEIAREVFAYV